ncbi:MAG: hypothetical protein ABSF98_12150 [Bryobacteraceae bacterium]|jgi:hypothetical protein
MQARRGYFGSVGEWVIFSAPEFRESKMTAIATVMGPWGVLMAADGRMCLSEAARPYASAEVLAKETDHAQKLFPIVGPDRAMVYGLAGSIANDDFTFDLRSELHRLASELAPQRWEDLLGYINALVEPVAMAITDAGHFPLKGESKSGGLNIAEAMFAGCFGSLIFLLTVEFAHSGGMCRARIVEVRHQSRNPICQICYGSRAVAQRMYDRRRGHAPIAGSPFARYIHDLGDSPTANDAERFAVGYIEACCSPTGLQLDPDGCRGIGGHIHVATVEPGGGFQWIRPPIAP